MEKKFLPTCFEVAVEAKLLEAHQADPTSEEAPGVLVGRQRRGCPDERRDARGRHRLHARRLAGDSAFIAPDQKTFKFRVTADKGSTLYYYCAIHPWMQGKIRVK